MGNKYIIDLNPDCVEGEYLRIPARIAGEEQWLVTKAALTPYTEPDLEEVMEEAYEKGLSDAWEAAKWLSKANAGVNFKVFGMHFTSEIVQEISASECIEKIRQHEQEKDRQVRIEYNFDEIKDVLETTAKECNVSLDEIAEVLRKMKETDNG